MVLRKAYDKYLELLGNDGQHHGHSDQESENDNEQGIMEQIIEFCRKLSQTNKRVRIRNIIHMRGHQLGHSNQTVDHVM